MQHKRAHLPVVLSIAGHDPSSGAGITADVKTMAANGCYGVTCITALTVQSTRGVKRIDPVEGRIITETLEHLMDDMEIAAVKIGMLGSAEAAKSVAAFLKRYYLRHVVLDPIIRASSGAELITRDGLQVMKDRILGRVAVITPNIDEAAALTGLTVTNMDEMQLAASRLHEMGVRNVVITGGHLDPPHDLVSREDRRSTVLEGIKISGQSTHGTGCAFSTALACSLAKGNDLLTAAKASQALCGKCFAQGAADRQGRWSSGLAIEGLVPKFKVVYSDVKDHYCWGPLLETKINLNRLALILRRLALLLWRSLLL